MNQKPQIKNPKTQNYKIAAHKSIQKPQIRNPKTPNHELPAHKSIYKDGYYDSLAFLGFK